MRKIIQILAYSEGDWLHALCDDGTVWYLNTIFKKWILIDEQIPQGSIEGIIFTKECEDNDTDKQ